MSKELMNEEEISKKKRIYDNTKINALGFVDSYINQINNEIREEEFDIWAQDILFLLKYLKELREKLVNNIIDSVTLKDSVCEVLKMEKPEEINYSLKQDGTLDFYISYNEGYNGKKLFEDQLEDFINNASEEPNKVRKQTK